MDTTEYSQDPYEDGTVPADTDMVTSSDEGAAEEPDDEALPDFDPEIAEGHS